MIIGQSCWRDKNGVAHESLPFRVHLPDGSTRTDSSQWSQDPEILSITGWSLSTVIESDIPPVPPPPSPDPFEEGFETSYGWKLAWKPDDVALLTGLYVLAKRASELGSEQPIIVTDMNNQHHSLTLAEFEIIMLSYGAARAALSAGGAT